MGQFEKLEFRLGSWNLIEQSIYISYSSVSLSVSLFGFERPTLCTTYVLIIYLVGFVRATLCTTSMVEGYVVHHQPALCTMVHKGDLCQSRCLSVSHHSHTVSPDAHFVLARPITIYSPASYLVSFI